MAVFEIVVFSIGSAIAKHIVKSWIDNDLLDGLAEEFIDLLKDQGQQTAEQRREQKDGEKLAAAMANRMRQVYDNSTLPSNSKQAVAIAVAQTLNITVLNVEQVIAHNMDTEKLARLLLARRPNATKLFSADENALYERLIFEGAFAAGQISALLQSFTGAFASKMLKDNTQILSMIEKVLRSPKEEAIAFTNYYKDTVKRKLDRLEIFGLPNLDPYSRRQSLSIAYISLDAEPFNRDIKALDFRSTTTIFEELNKNLSQSLKINDQKPTALNFLFQAINTNIESSSSDDAWIPRFRQSVTHRLNSIEDILADKRRIVVQGQAGSGKTTLLQWLAVRSASSDFDPPLSNWNETIPFFIRLREYIDIGFPTPKQYSG